VSVLTRPTDPDHAFRHDAFVHESQDEYVARSVAFLREGLAAGEGAIVGNTRDGLAVMREALGPDAERVAFCDVGSFYTRPARTLAGYHGTFLGQLQTSRSVRAVAEYQLGPMPADWEEWAAYEAMTNVSYSHLPVWVVCTYDANGLPDPVLESVGQTHAEMLTDGWHESGRFQEPRELVRNLTPEPRPLPDLRAYPGGGDDLAVFRVLLASELVAQGVPDAKVLDMLVAGTEIAANAVRYGGGITEVRLGRVDGRFVCEVVDRGQGFDDPLAGYLVPRDGIGTGLWVARQLAWRLEFFHSPRGFTARIWA
jgi:anti-sigma regulatory factor (Ser/Thr protein kinase)